MNKSSSNALDDERDGRFVHVVSRLDVGRRVLVNNRFTGILKYVGKIIGKDGIFCGIELDDPIGKHNGTHRNINYFECRPLHGIFAPTFKVELEDVCNNVDKPVANAPSILAATARRPNSLVRSAIPALTSSRYSSRTNANIAPISDSMTSSESSSGDPTKSKSVHDTMNWSFISAGSSMENSLLSYDAGAIEDLMMNSNHTYVVTNSDCLMLTDIEIKDSTLLKFDDDEEDINNNINLFKEFSRINQKDSVVLERPTLDSRLLPVIGSSSASENGDYEAIVHEVEDEEAATPMVEHSVKKFPGDYGEIQSTTNTTTRARKEDNAEDFFYSETLTITETSNGHQASDTPSFSSSSSQNDSTTLPNENLTTRLKKQKFETQQTTISAKKSTDKKNAIKKNNEESVKRKRPPKKQRISLKEIIQQQSVVAAPRPPKPPSKSQLVMERIKASIEADRNKPKKEIKSKVTGSLQADIKTNDPTEAEAISHVTPTNENVKPEKMIVVPMKSPSAYSRTGSNLSNRSSTLSVARASTAANVKQPAQQNGTLRFGLSNDQVTTAMARNRPTASTRLTKDVTTTAAARIPLKARQNQPPPTHNASENDKRIAPRYGATAVSRFQRPSSRTITKPSIITTNTAALKPKAPVKKLLSQAEEKQLRNQLTWNSKAAQVFSIVTQWETQQRDIAERKRLRQIEQIRADFLDELNTRCNALNEKVTVAERERADVAGRLERSEQTIATLERRYADERAALMQRAEEAESALAAALAQKRELEAAVSKSENATIKKLSNDISSLNFVLDQKTEELRKERARNLQLLSAEDELREKRIELHKLQNRFDESKEQLQRQQLIQKDLVQQLEKCKEQMEMSMHHSQITVKENEMLKYKIEHLNEFTPREKSADVPLFDSLNSFNCSTPLSSRASNAKPVRHHSGENVRPNSSSAIGHPREFRTPPRVILDAAMPVTSNGSNVMHKSLDAVAISALSIYQSQGRSGRATKNTPTKIYAPEGTFEVNDSDLCEYNDNDVNDNHKEVEVDEAKIENNNINVATTNPPINDDFDAVNAKLLAEDFVDFDATADSVH